jgi:hypothetical protein
MPTRLFKQLVTVLMLLIVLVFVTHLDFGAGPGNYPGGPTPQPVVAPGSGPPVTATTRTG